MSQLGFTFYPKDWWTSDSFFLLQPFERYIYLECLFIMYSQDGWMSSNKLIVERRLGTTIKDEVWNKIKDLFISEGDQLTHKSVNSRMRKTLSNRENGKLGGRPKKEEVTKVEKPKKPNSETQKNPPSEIEEEREKEKEREDEKQKLTPPTLDEVKKYFSEKGYTEEAAVKAFDYYDAGKWIDGQGNKVKNWKQKMIAVWMKPEHKRQIATITQEPKRRRL